MPITYQKAFSDDQMISKNTSSDYNVNCLFYSDNQEILWQFLKESYIPDYEKMAQFGTIVVSSISALIKLYEILKDKKPHGIFKVEIVRLLNKHQFYEIQGFEGEIGDFEKMIE